MEDDTIVAVATPPGRGALSIVRLSGPSTASVLQSLCPGVTSWSDRQATVARIRTSHGGVLDEAVITYFQGPRSYSGEEMAEITCHGNPQIVDRIVGESLTAGARSARPGEFTLRAFLNGRIDLAQAEAVVDLIEAKTDAGVGLALGQLHGRLSRSVERLHSELLDLLAHITALVDFSEEEIPSLADHEIRETIASVLSRVNSLLEGAHQGQVLQHGVSLAIVGPPNAGKSSILNGLLGRDRAIVTPIAGTTRDTLEEELSLGGVSFHVVDTAGLAQTEDPIEVIGIERSRQAMEAAEVLLAVVDRSRELSEEDRRVLTALRQDIAGRPVMVALNKSDLPSRGSFDGVKALIGDAELVETCAVSSDGLDELRKLLPMLALGGPIPDGFVVSNQRHIHSLRAAAEALECALTAGRGGVPLDLVGLDIRSAAGSLGEVLGVEIGDQLLDRVFSRFCIGK